jgi:hypothetical protein
MKAALSVVAFPLMEIDEQVEFAVVKAGGARALKRLPPRRPDELDGKRSRSWNRLLASAGARAFRASFNPYLASDATAVRSIFGQHHRGRSRVGHSTADLSRRGFRGPEMATKELVRECTRSTTLRKGCQQLDDPPKKSANVRFCQFLPLMMIAAHVAAALGQADAQAVYL